MIVYGLAQEEKRDLRLFPWVWLHGELEKKNKYDLVSIENGPTEEGIYPCDIILCDGTETKGTLYYWPVAYRNIGLVVEDGDTEAIKYAKKCYRKKLEGI